MEDLLIADYENISFSEIRFLKNNNIISPSPTFFAR